MGEGGGEGTPVEGKNLASIKCNVEPKASEITLIEGGFTWPIPFTGEGGQISASLVGEAKGDLVWTGPEKEKPDVEKAKADASAGAGKWISDHFVVPLTQGWPDAEFSAGGDLEAFGKQWEKGKEETETSITIVEMTLCSVELKTPGAKTPSFTVELKCAACSVNLAEPLASSIAKLTGAGEMIIISASFSPSPNLKIKGGISCGFEVSGALVTFQDIIEGVGVDVLITAGFIIAGVLSIAIVVRAFAIVDAWMAIPDKLQQLTDAYVGEYMPSFCGNQGIDDTVEHVQNPNELDQARKAGTEDGYACKKDAVAKFFGGDWNKQEAWYSNWNQANKDDLQAQVTATAKLHFQTEMWKKMGTGQSYQDQRGTWLWIWNCNPADAKQVPLFQEIADKSGSAGFFSGVW